MASNGLSIGYVSLQTGLSTHVIRAWERRYQALSPRRSAGGRRLYTQADINRLRHLKRLVDIVQTEPMCDETLEVDLALLDHANQRDVIDGSTTQ